MRIQNILSRKMVYLIKLIIKNIFWGIKNTTQLSLIILFYFFDISNSARHPQLTETNRFFFPVASIIGNVIREKMRLIQMLHIELPSQRHKTRDIDLNGMFQRDIIPSLLRARHYCVLEKTSLRKEHKIMVLGTIFTFRNSRFLW